MDKNIIEKLSKILILYPADWLDVIEHKVNTDVYTDDDLSRIWGVIQKLNLYRPDVRVAYEHVSTKYVEYKDQRDGSPFDMSNIGYSTYFIPVRTKIGSIDPPIIVQRMKASLFNSAFEDFPGCDHVYWNTSIDQKTFNLVVVKDCVVNLYSIHCIADNIQFVIADALEIEFLADYWFTPVYEHLADFCKPNTSGFNVTHEYSQFDIRHVFKLVPEVSTRFNIQEINANEWRMDYAYPLTINNEDLWVQDSIRIRNLKLVNTRYTANTYDMCMFEYFFKKCAKMELKEHYVFPVFGGINLDADYTSSLDVMLDVLSNVNKS